MRSNIHRFGFAVVACAALTALALFGSCAGLAVAQPAEPLLRILVGYPPGGGTDTLARVLAEAIALTLKRTVIVENKPGAGGQIAALALKSAPPDASVIMLAPNGLTTVQTIVYAQQLKYDFAKDFAPVARVSSTALAVAVPAELKIADVKGFAVWLKANPSKAFFGTPAAGGLPHFAGLLVGKELGVELTHIPYKGGAPTAIAVASGEVPMGISGIDDFVRLDEAGKLKIIGTLGEGRTAVFPGADTLREQGIAVQTANWTALWAPAGTPEAKLQPIAAAVEAALQTASVKQRMAAAYTTPDFLSGAGLAKLQQADWERWRPVIKASGFKPEQ
jgi:tripartite-type tricarboxylate transporter receptor subunit TctC